GMQAGRSASGCPQEDCFRQPETGRGASRLRSHAERGNEELFYFGYTQIILMEEDQYPVGHMVFICQKAREG
ncbi:MAG: hypothetical protein GY749_44750, partial [Desulfobacteraceae bacterium]|nr:hypothetical protein [Desulfobacteraceae bacterium]